MSSDIRKRCWGQRTGSNVCFQGIWCNLQKLHNACSNEAESAKNQPVTHCLEASSYIIDGSASPKAWAWDRQAHFARTVVRSALVVACKAFVNRWVRTLASAVGGRERARRLVWRAFGATWFRCAVIPGNAAAQAGRTAVFCYIFFLKKNITEYN